MPACSLNGDNVNVFTPILFNTRCIWERKITTSLLNLWLCVNILN